MRSGDADSTLGEVPRQQGTSFGNNALVIQLSIVHYHESIRDRQLMDATSFHGSRDGSGSRSRVSHVFIVECMQLVPRWGANSACDGGMVHGPHGAA